MSRHQKAIERWASQSAISARSVLVTIFGDTLLPVTGSVWLAQLFQLTEVFGFNQRLIRTSAARLVTEGWLENERVGRVSRYHLTPLAVEESNQAAEQIYSSTNDEWDGDWVLVFANKSVAEPEVRPTLQQHLQWRGFSDLGNGVLASPTASLDSTRELCQMLSPDHPIPLATARFDDVEEMAASGFFRSGFAVDVQEQAYTDFVRDYTALAKTLTDLDSVDAYGVRTMLVHDLRRIRLRSAAIPAQLLPSPWIGDAAFDLASSLYAKASTKAAPFLSELLEEEYPVSISGRF